MARKFKQGDAVALTQAGDLIAKECKIKVGAKGVVSRVFPASIKKYPYDVKFEGYPDAVPVAEIEIEGRK